MLHHTLRTLAVATILMGSTAARAHVDFEFVDLQNPSNPVGLDLHIFNLSWTGVEPHHNSIEVSMNADGMIVITGLEREGNRRGNPDGAATLIGPNLVRSVTIPAPRRNLVIDLTNSVMAPGTARVVIRDVHFIDGGQHIDIVASDVEMSNCLTLFTSSAEIRIVAVSIDIEVCAAQADIGLFGCKVEAETILARGDLHVNSAAAANGSSIALDDIFTERNLYVTGSDGDDLVSVLNCVAIAAAEFALYAGDDDLIISGLDGGAVANSDDPANLMRLKIEFAEGADDLWIENARVDGGPESALVTIDGGQGVDIYYLPADSSPNTFQINKVTTNFEHAKKE